MVFGGFWWFLLVLVGSLWFFVVLGYFWWFLVDLDGSWLFLVVLGGNFFVLSHLFIGVISV